MSREYNIEFRQIKKYFWINTFTSNCNSTLKSEDTLTTLLIFMLIFLAPVLSAKESSRSTTIEFQDNEKWWFGVVSQAHNMPFNDEPFEIGATETARCRCTAAKSFRRHDSSFDLPSSSSG